MVLRYLVFCFLILNYCGFVFGKVCSDCQDYTSCPAAYNIIGDKPDAETQDEFMSTFCGVRYDDNGDRIPKVCCSDFDENNLEQHPNRYLLPNTCGYVDVYPTDIISLYEFPWIAFFNFTENKAIRKFACDGVIINSRYILTTSYCATKYPAQFVRVGDFNPDTAIDCSPTDPKACEDFKQDIFIEEIIKHPNATFKVPDIKNNIALVRLKSEMDFSHRNIAPICLPLSRNIRNSYKGGKTGVVAGWEYYDRKRNFSNFLKLPATVQDTQDCIRMLYNNRPELTLENFICVKITLAKEKACTALTGDAFIAVDMYHDIKRYIIYGLYSHGPSSCSESPDVFVDVSKYMKWILDNLRP